MINSLGILLREGQQRIDTEKKRSDHVAMASGSVEVKHQTRQVSTLGMTGGAQAGI